ncbi:hypothetical protein EDD18DRAFT_1155889 [Armillaria luteobubalina]|uniref:Antifungal protein n=1 Tax=Armillaria luteobubalina TaxID=153913 RepID=A0AA39UQN2_9AGAR|nr:hypothetical protein EDD18DRAFT_1155889 [Armillaria luteobubalina]
MIFSTKSTVMALAAMFLFVGHASALTKNPVDACKHKKDDVGHSCVYDSSHGKVEGTCQKGSDGMLSCVHK